MQHSTPSVHFQATDSFDDLTAHGLLVAAHLHARNLGFFSSIDRFVSLKMKTVDYSWQQKLHTLWASVVVGCNHTVQINDRLGAHERASAALFGLERFPDQSNVNRLLHAVTPEHLPQWRALHLALLARHSRGKRRRLWARLANQQRVLFIDIDQRSLVVSSNHFELCAKGHFGRKRGRWGYQLSLAFLGGQVGEVLDEHLDPGNTPAATCLDDLLDAVLAYCTRTGIKPSSVVIRADALYGTVDIVQKIQARGFHFLLKGISRQRAAKLLSGVPDQIVFAQVDNGHEREPAWMCDLGEREHRHGRKAGAEHAVRCRTLVLVRHLWKNDTRRAGPKQRAQKTADGRARRRVRRVDYFVTDLEARQLPVAAVLPTYHDRSTIERYFYDEAYGLGARQVRTKHFPGQALFQFLVATTNNLLRWMKHSLFKGTEIERMGICRLVHSAMQIPARIRRLGNKILVEFPARHHLVAALSRSWPEMLPSAGGT